MVRRRVTMDRVFEMSQKINKELQLLNSELQLYSLKHPTDELKKLLERYNKLQNDHANLITLGHPDSWRVMAEGNGFHQEGE